MRSDPTELCFSCFPDKTRARLSGSVRLGPLKHCAPLGSFLDRRHSARRCLVPGSYISGYRRSSLPRAGPDPMLPARLPSTTAIIASALCFLVWHVTVGSCGCSCLHTGLDTLNCADFDLVFSGVPLPDADGDARSAGGTSSTSGGGGGSSSSSSRRWAWQTLIKPVAGRTIGSGKRLRLTSAATGLVLSMNGIVIVVHGPPAQLT